MVGMREVLAPTAVRNGRRLSQILFVQDGCLTACGRRRLSGGLPGLPGG
jgi:hypothetical protein